MKKGDLAIILVIFILANIFGYMVTVNKEKVAKTVTIVRDGEILHRYKFDDTYQKSISLDFEGQHNVVEIKDGKVIMTESNCHDKICVKTKSISQNGEMIVCLPHKLYVKIEGDEASEPKEDEIDIVVN